MLPLVGIEPRPLVNLWFKVQQKPDCKVYSEPNDASSYSIKVLCIHTGALLTNNKP